MSSLQTSLSAPPVAETSYESTTGIPNVVALPGSVRTLVASGGLINRAGFSGEGNGVVALRIPVRKMREANKLLGDSILRLKGKSPVSADPKDPKRKFLKLTVSEEELKAMSEVQSWMDENKVTTSILPQKHGYDDLSLNEVLTKVLPLPEGSDIPSSYECIGKIAHVNLRDEHVPYRFVIGQAFLDKVPSLNIVVNKRDVLASGNQFRVFPMEVIAQRDAPELKDGEEPVAPSLVTRVRESNSWLHLDYAKVYWNSRLQGEHKRLCDTIIESVYSGMNESELAAIVPPRREGSKPKGGKSQDRPHLHGDPAAFTVPKGKNVILADMMAGIGPFAVPAGVRGVTVFANDLNPHSFKWLDHNIKANKVGKKVKGFNLDGREFMAKMVQKDSVFPHHVSMNLPASATTFLDVFKGLYVGCEKARLPRIHCYCFSAAEKEQLAADGQRMCEEVLGGSLAAEGNVSVHLVRNVAPKKQMLCVSFDLPPVIAYNSSKIAGAPSSPKRTIEP